MEKSVCLECNEEQVNVRKRPLLSHFKGVTFDCGMVYFVNDNGNGNVNSMCGARALNNRHINQTETQIENCVEL